MVLFRSIWGLTVLSGWVRDGAECEGYARFPDKEEDTIRLRVRQLDWRNMTEQELITLYDRGVITKSELICQLADLPVLASEMWQEEVKCWRRTKTGNERSFSIAA